MISMPLSKAAAAINATLIGKDLTFTGCSTDTRTIEKGNLFIALKGEHFNGHNFVSKAEQCGAVALLLDEEVNSERPVLKVEETRKAMGLLAKSWREFLAIPVIAVTGSNGKTTVKEMLSSIFSVIAKVHATAGNYNNDIGVPLTLFGLDKKHEYAVIEMGANHPGEIEWLSSIASPNVAVITQCAPSHLEGFGSIEGVAKAKAEIYSGLQSDGTAIINADDDYADYWKATCEHLKQFSFGIKSESANVIARNIETLTETNAIKFELHCEQQAIDIILPLSGEHNVMNALAAAACCLSLGVSLETIKAGLEKMSAVKGRLQIKAGKQGSRVIDDTYNANPKSLSAAINVLNKYSGSRYLVLGDMGELGETAVEHHKQAGKLARSAGVDGLFCIGELSLHAKESFGNGAIHFTSYDELESSLLNSLTKDTTLLVKGSRYMQMDRVVNSLVEEQN